jgi:hypothetical protein
MQHAETEYLGVLDEDMKTAILQLFKPEELARALPPEERIRGLPPEERIRGLPPEERLSGLSEEELDRLRELLEQRRDA